MAPASTINLDKIFSEAIERSKQLRVVAPKSAQNIRVLDDGRSRLESRFDPNAYYSSLSVPVSAYRSNVRGKAALATARRRFTDQGGRVRPSTWKGAKQCAARTDARRVESLNLAINKARRGLIVERDACRESSLALGAPESRATDDTADGVGELTVACSSRFAPKADVLVLPEDGGSEAEGSMKQPPQSRYTPRRVPPAPQSSMSRMPQSLFGSAAAPSEKDALPSLSRWQRNSKQDKKEAAIIEIVRELEVLGKLLTEGSSKLKRRGLPDVGVVHRQCRRVC